MDTAATADQHQAGDSEHVLRADRFSRDQQQETGLSERQTNAGAGLQLPTGRQTSQCGQQIGEVRQVGWPIPVRR